MTKKKTVPPVSIAPIQDRPKYSLSLWLFCIVLVALFALILRTDPYYQQVPLWGIR